MGDILIQFIIKNGKINVKTSWSANATLGDFCLAASHMDVMKKNLLEKIEKLSNKVEREGLSDK